MNYLKINTPDVISEHFEDEVIAIQIKQGIYYIIGQSGVLIWEQMAHGATFAEIVSHLTRAYHGEESLIIPAVQDFLEQLRQADLIVSLPANSAPGAGTANLITTTAPLRPFLPPTISENTDIQDILLLDPVHEVRKQGWFA